jgi:hypothetical protein
LQPLWPLKPDDNSANVPNSRAPPRGIASHTAVRQSPPPRHPHPSVSYHSAPQRPLTALHTTATTTPSTSPYQSPPITPNHPIQPAQNRLPYMQGVRCDNSTSGLSTSAVRSAAPPADGVIDRPTSASYQHQQQRPAATSTSYQHRKKRPAAPSPPKGSGWCQSTREPETAHQPPILRGRRKSTLCGTLSTPRSTGQHIQHSTAPHPHQLQQQPHRLQYHSVHAEEPAALCRAEVLEPAGTISHARERGTGARPRGGGGARAVTESVSGVEGSESARETPVAASATLAPFGRA